jgi:hypothetical protein
MRLIQRRIVEKYPTFKIFEFDSWPAGMTNKGSREYPMEFTGMTLPDLCLSEDTFVFIDDAQSSYYDGYLWSLFKILEGGAYFILFSSYGSPGPMPVEVKAGTPPIFCPEQRISLSWESTGTETPIGILLAHNEAHDLITRYCTVHQNRPQFSGELRDFLITISGGHAGALSGLVDIIVTDHACIPFLGIGEPVVANSLRSR